MSDADGPVVGDRPARVVRDFPHVAIGVGEGSGHAAPLGACRRPHDLPAGLLSLGKYCSDLFWGSNIVRKLYAGCAMAPKCRPEPQNHAASLEEADLLVRLLCAVTAHQNIHELGRPLYALGWAPSANRPVSGHEGKARSGRGLVTIRRLSDGQNPAHHVAPR